MTETGSTPDSTHPIDARRPHRLVLILIVGIIPWTVISGDGITFVHLFGLLSVDPLSVTDLYSYLFVLTDGLPRRLQAWPISAGLYLGGLASLVSGFVVREDPRLTAGLFVLAGGTHLHVWYGLLSIGVTALPVGPICMGFVIWWCYWPLLRHA